MEILLMIPSLLSADQRFDDLQIGQRGNIADLVGLVLGDFAEVKRKRTAGERFCRPGGVYVLL
jgi:hypothetical protein